MPKVKLNGKLFLDERGVKNGTNGSYTTNGANELRPQIENPH